MNLDICEFEVAQQPKVATKIRINVADLIFNQSARFFVYLQDDNNDIVKVETIDIQEEEYKSWNDNDDYIINLILNKLGLIPKPKPIEQPKTIEEPNNFSAEEIINE